MSDKDIIDFETLLKEIQEQRKTIAELKSALIEIAEAKGRYNQDKLRFNVDVRFIKSQGLNRSIINERMKSKKT